MPTEFWSSGDPWLCLFVRLRCSYRGSETVKLLEVKSCKLFRFAVLAVCVLMWLSLNGFGTAVNSCQVASKRTSAWLLPSPFYLAVVCGQWGFFSLINKH